MKSKVKQVAAVGVAAVAAAALTFCLLKDEKAEVSTSEPIVPAKAETNAVKKAAQSKGAFGKKVSRPKTPGQEAKKSAKKTRRVFEDDFSPEDRKLADAVQEALDGDDFKQTRAAAALAMQSKNPEVRQAAVDALGWFGDKALVDLTKAMSDKDADVAEAARGQVEQALMGMEDAHMAFALASSYVESFGKDKEAATMLLGIMESTGSQLTEPDDSDSAEDVKKARTQRSDIVEAFDALIAQGGGIAKEAREMYENITGNAWTDRAAADAWANDVPDPEKTDSENDEAASDDSKSPN